jgi:hypothetical protein
MAMKTPAYVGAVVGVIALIGVAVLADFTAMLRRELAWGVPTLIGWQWVEGRRLRRVASP